MKRNLFNFVVIVVLLMAATVACDRDKAVTGVTLNETALELTIDETARLTPTVQPNDAANRNVTWESSDPEVATVVRGFITAIAYGTAIITVTTEDGNHTATCRVTVIPHPDPVEPEMIFVEGGIFTMGCTDGCEAGSNELPTLQVSLSSYYIAKYPVTQREWRAIMRNNPSHFKGEDLPVENVTMDDIETFIEELNKIYRPNSGGPQYRLATEAEWEFAARGGNQSHGYRFSGSNNIGEVAWYSDNSAGNTNIRERRTHPVGTKAANELGIHDMSGNVWEWCSDLYALYSDTSRRQFDPVSEMWINPQGPTIGVYHVARGGSWIDFPQLCRVSARSFPMTSRNNLGFRLVLSAE